MIETLTNSQSLPWGLAISALALLLAIASLAFQLAKYGPAIKKLTEIDVFSSISWLNSNIEDLTSKLGGNSTRLQQIDMSLERHTGRLSGLQEQVSVLSGLVPRLESALETANNDHIIEKNNAQEAPATNLVAKKSEQDPSWEEIRGKWQEVREVLEQLIDNITDGRRRRKYYDLPRYNYDDIIITLHRDKILSAHAGDAALAMNAIYFRVRPRKELVSKEQLEEFNDAFRNLMNDSAVCRLKS